ncbi:MAG: ATP phosphoribosyltransferase regulatory subunit [Rubricella sp.]
MDARAEYLDGARRGPLREAVAAEVARLLTLFEGAGAEVTEAPALLDAETLLDLYGEDIRTRAYITHDPVEGELALRPDFTVPLLQMHGEGAARYAYAGPVWRRQEPGSARPVEYLQVGVEFLGDMDRAAADAELFALIHGAVEGQGLTIATGDMGLLRDAIGVLDISERRRAALMRHVSRPGRFARLVRRFSGEGTVGPARCALLDAAREGDAALKAHIREAGPVRGERSLAEIMDRARNLAAEADAPPLSSADRALLDAVLGIGGSMADAALTLEEIAQSRPALSDTLERFRARMAALEARGFDPGALPFEARFGRTTLEYYDGFVFGFHDPARPDLSPLASGGRYDALTRAFGKALPAVGGIVKPQALLARGGRP